jgi:hypothetical protein
MGLMSAVLAGAFAALLEATRANESVRLVTGMNQHLRSGMDLIVRDLIQVGQGLPTGRVIAVPSGGGALPILRPGPAGTNYTFDPAATSLSAVTVGPGLGPVVGGQPTDMITVLAADNAFDHVRLAALNDTSMRVVADVDISGQPDVPGDNLRVGDLIMLTKQSLSLLVYVTAVNGQVVRFDEGDPLELNQRGADDGTLPQYVAAAPLENTGPQCPQQPAQCVVPTVATRIRMISYYLEPPGPDGASRLIRRVNAQPETVVAFGLEQLLITYDIVDDLLNPVDVAMTPDDVAGNGACDADLGTAPPVPCSPGQVRKVNVRMAVRSARPLRSTGLFFRNVLSTQVSLRSLALVDRYS